MAHCDRFGYLDNEARNPRETIGGTRCPQRVANDAAFPFNLRLHRFISIIFGEVDPPARVLNGIILARWANES
jgi:hypothetical protein